MKLKMKKELDNYVEEKPTVSTKQSPNCHTIRITLYYKSAGDTHRFKGDVMF